MHKPVLVLLVALLTAGCGIIYRQPIYQGNLLETAAVEQLQAGMSKQQVMTLLGTPAIQDPFHHDRWDYTASQRVDRRGTIVKKNLTLWFEGETLAKWEGDYFPEQDAEISKSAARQFGRNLPPEKDRRRP